MHCIQLLINKISNINLSIFFDGEKKMSLLRVAIYFYYFPLNILFWAYETMEIVNEFNSLAFFTVSAVNQDNNVEL